MPTGDDSRAMFTATIIMRKLNAINKSPIANFIGNDGSKFFLASCAQIPAKIGANKTTITGFANCNQPTGISYPTIDKSV